MIQPKQVKKITMDKRAVDDETVRSIFLIPQPNAQTAFDEAMARYGENATVIAMPFGGATLPIA